MLLVYLRMLKMLSILLYLVFLSGIKKPDTLYLDGISLLPVLTKAIKLDKLMAYHNLNKHSKKGSLSEGIANITR